MQINGQNSIVGQLALEINDPYLNASRKVVVSAGESISVDAAFRFAPSVLEAINQGLITVTPEPTDEVLQVDLQFVNNSGLKKVQSAFGGGAPPGFTFLYNSQDHFADGNFFRVGMTIRNLDSSLGMIVRITTANTFGATLVTNTVVAAGVTTFIDIPMCAAFTIETSRETTGAPQFDGVLEGYYGVAS